MIGSLRTLLTDLIDYAGLFPPAKLDMARAVEAYNRALVGPHEFMLGRFICPVSRLDEFSRLAAPLMPGTFATSGYREQAEVSAPWRISALIDGELKANLDAIDAFNERHSSEDAGQARIDAIELKVTRASEIDDALDVIPQDLYAFFEFPVGDAADCRGFVAALAGNASAAKIRTGGIVAGAFPTPREVADFLAACAAADVPFKATAGLHHPVRGSHRLTYEKDSASCTMHGFLNLFVAAALIRARKIDANTAAEILSDEEPANFHFADGVLSWKGFGLEAAVVARARETFALSFGSCSFDEPAEDLSRLRLL